MASRILASNVPAITVRDRTGGAWRVYPTDCRDEQRDDGKLLATTPKGEDLLIPPVEQWDARRVYEGATGA